MHETSRLQELRQADTYYNGVIVIRFEAMLQKRRRKVKDRRDRNKISKTYSYVKINH